jgi:hypothetical protein
LQSQQYVLSCYQQQNNSRAAAQPLPASPAAREDISNTGSADDMQQEVILSCYVYSQCMSWLFLWLLLLLLQGDNNYGDDRLLYARGQEWLHMKHIMGRAVG